jgi:hypothetical protein
MVSVPRAGLRGIRPALAGKLEEGTAFALRARDGVDRFQCLLRSGPAAARVARRSEPAPDHLAIFAPQAGNPGYSPARITGREEGLTPIAFPKFGNRSLPPSPSSGFLREALPDLHEKFAATGRVASLLAC